MPYSEKQRIVAAIALHSPGKLHKKNRSVLSMTREQLRDYASGPVEKKPRKRPTHVYGDKG